MAPADKQLDRMSGIAPGCYNRMNTFLRRHAVISIFNGCTCQCSEKCGTSSELSISFARKRRSSEEFTWVYGEPTAEAMARAFVDPERSVVIGSTTDT